MVKDVKSMQNLGEVAPALLISHQKPSSSPRLETIAEEDCGGTLLNIEPSMEGIWRMGEHQKKNQLAKK
ncbi:hypothetical protein QQP08_019421 [Theobroma cacao]|nr:hypothetical protein QQP08_019421 [Theobroma cacao]